MPATQRFWRTPVVAVIGVALALGPLVPPAAAQQATPTATARPAVATTTPTLVVVQGQTVTGTVIPVTNTLPGTPVAGLSGTPVAVQTSTPTGINPLPTCSDISGASHIFQVCPTVATDSAELALEQWAVQADLQLFQLPASDASRVMAWDRGGLRGLILARLENATKKPTNQQTPEEQAMLGYLSNEIKLFKLGAAQEAKREYQQWQANPFCFAPPAVAQAAAGGYNPCNPDPSPAERANIPAPPSYGQFQAWSNAVELSLLKQPVDDAIMGDMGLRAKVVYGVVGSTVPGSGLAYLAGQAAPRSWFNETAPYRYRKFNKLKFGGAEASKGSPTQVARQAVQAEANTASDAAKADAAAAEAASDAGAAAEDSVSASADAAVSATEAALETAEASGAAADAAAATVSTVSSTAGAAGGILFAGPAAIIILSLTSAILEGIDVFTAAKIPGQLDAAIAAAQNPPDLADADNQLLQLFIGIMTSPDFPSSSDVGSPPAAGDLGWVFSAQGQTSVLHYLSPDGSFHTLRASSDGWFVDGQDGGPTHRTLSVDVLDKYYRVWSITRRGNTLAVERSSDADPSHITLQSWFNAIDWSPTDQDGVVGRYVTMVQPGGASPMIPRPDLAGRRVMNPSQDIFLIDSDGAKAHIPNPATYGRLFRDWNNILPLDQATLDAIPESDTISDGAFLGHISTGNTSDPAYQMIWLFSDGRRRWINSPAAMDQYYFNGDLVENVATGQDCSTLASTGQCAPTGAYVPEVMPIAASGYPVPAAPWIIGATQAAVGGGYVARFDPATNSFDKVDGAATVVSAGPDGQPWLVNAQGAIFRRSRGSTSYVDGSWQTMPGQASAVSVGANGDVWAIGTASDVANVGGSHIYHYNAAGNSWDQVDGGAVAVAVGPDGQPWIVNKQGTIFRRTLGNNAYVDGTWQTVPGQATAIAVGANGDVWVIGTNAANIGGNMIYHYNPSNPNGWDQVDGGGVAISVGADGQPWLVNKQGAVFARSKGSTGYVDGAWTTVAPSGTATAVAAGDSL